MTLADVAHSDSGIGVERKCKQSQEIYRKLTVLGLFAAASVLMTELSNSE